MALETEIRTTPAQKENISFLTKEVVKLVSVRDYLNLRYPQADTELEIRQILDSGLVDIDNLQVEPTNNIYKDGARRLITKIPLSTFLEAKQQVLIREIEINAQKVLNYSLVGWEEARGEFEEKGKRLAAELDLLHPIKWGENK